MWHTESRWINRLQREQAPLVWPMMANWAMRIPMNKSAPKHRKKYRRGGALICWLHKRFALWESPHVAVVAFHHFKIWKFESETVVSICKEIHCVHGTQEQLVRNEFITLNYFEFGNKNATLSQNAFSFALDKPKKKKPSKYNVFPFLLYARLILLFRFMFIFVCVFFFLIFRWRHIENIYMCTTFGRPIRCYSISRRWR